MTGITDRDREIANTIYEQLGGCRFSVMVGAKRFVTIERGFVFNLSKNKSGANYAFITLSADDTYKVELRSVSIKGHKTKAVREGVYCDKLQETFTDLTGLHTRI